MSQDITKAPRLYIAQDLILGKSITMDKDQAHYLLTVMRKEQGDAVRLFNGRDGEFVARIEPTSKKAGMLWVEEQIKAQPVYSREIHLYFAPIKKDRMAFMIEKAVELGVTDLHPIMTDHTENRNVKTDKMERYIIEASEQCERLSVPRLHDVKPLQSITFDYISFVALERVDAPTFTDTSPSDNIGLLIGPEGGWSAEERGWFEQQENYIKAVSLGDQILRAETAAIYMLARLG